MASDDHCGGGSERSDLYEFATETWGEEPQIDMVGEECSELATEVFRYWRGRSDESDLADEAADVEIILEQLRVIIGDELVDSAKERKLNRLEKRLQEAGADV